MSRSLTMPLLSVAALLLTGCAAGAQENPPAEDSSAPPSAAAATSPRLEGLEALPAEQKVSDDFDPAAFGPAMTAETGEGCSTYVRALVDLLDDPMVGTGEGDSCSIASGSLIDPDDGMPVNYEPAEDDGQYVDRLVSLEEAWASGADQWTDEQRLEFANDVQTLYVSSPATTAERAGADAAGWLPAEGTCRYIDDQVWVKTTYGLAVDEAERTAMERVLVDCP